MLRVCCHQFFDDLLRAERIKLVGTTCCENEKAKTSCCQGVSYFLFTMRGPPVRLTSLQQKYLEKYCLLSAAIVTLVKLDLPLFASFRD
jgi:hypothetical protein